jgi:type II secretory pathway component PulF
MSTFRYRGFDASGRARQGFLEALDRKDAREKLAARGVLAESVDPVAGEVGHPPRVVRIFGVAQRATFYRELGALPQSGYTAYRRAGFVAGNPGAGNVRPDASRWLRDRIREGQTLARRVG